MYNTSNLHENWIKRAKFIYDYDDNASTETKVKQHAQISAALHLADEFAASVKAEIKGIIEQNNAIMAERRELVLNSKLERINSTLTTLLYNIDKIKPLNAIQ
jgi:hypothetical protein